MGDKWTNELHQPLWRTFPSGKPFLVKDNDDFEMIFEQADQRSGFHS